MAVRVRIYNLSKRYGDVVALDGVSFEVEPGELFFLIGPSGCGKTTLLRAIAGFVQADTGRVHFDDRDMTAVVPYKRNTALVFQGYALWPHMTVEQNVEYGLRVRELSAVGRRRRVAEILEVVQMSDLRRRYPSELSGGQQQRVALARAIVVRPDVLLLDEPLSNLDARLRVEMRREILRIHRETGITTIYVTHDQKEALSMGQRIAILDRGQIAQIGRPDECYRRPRTRFVARFLGEANFIEGNIVRVLSDGSCEVTTAVGQLTVKAEGGNKTTDSRLADAALHPSAFNLQPSTAVVGQSVCCCFRPESLELVGPTEGGRTNCFRARVTHMTYLGETLEYEMSAANGSVNLQATVMGSGPSAPEGSEVLVAVAPDDIVLLEPEKANDR